MSWGGGGAPQRVFLECIPHTIPAWGLGCLGVQKSIPKLSTAETASRTGLTAAGTAQDIPPDDRYMTTSQLHFGAEARSTLEAKVCSVDRFGTSLVCCMWGVGPREGPAKAPHTVWHTAL